MSQPASIPPITIAPASSGLGVTLTLASGHTVEVPLYTQNFQPHAAGIKTLLSILALHEASHTTPNPKRIVQSHTPVAHLVEQAIAAGGLRAFTPGSKPKQVLNSAQMAELLSDLDSFDFTA